MGDLACPEARAKMVSLDEDVLNLLKSCINI